MKAVYLCGKLRVLLFTSAFVKCGTELRYDYAGGDLHWRMVSSVFMMTGIMIPSF